VKVKKKIKKMQKDFKNQVQKSLKTPINKDIGTKKNTFPFIFTVEVPPLYPFNLVNSAQILCDTAYSFGVGDYIFEDFEDLQNRIFLSDNLCLYLTQKNIKIDFINLISYYVIMINTFIVHSNIINTFEDINEFVKTDYFSSSIYSLQFLIR
jgi:hypothetical protein